MKVVKSQVLLFMHETLMKKNEIDPNIIKEKFEITDKTFLRYIQELRAYFCNMYKNDKIVYSKSEKKYFLLSNTNI